MQGVPVKCCYSQTGLHDVKVGICSAAFSGRRNVSGLLLHGIFGGTETKLPCSAYGVCSTWFHVLEDPCCI